MRTALGTDPPERRAGYARVSTAMRAALRLGGRHQVVPHSCPPDGHDLAREIIAKHGIDRYPAAELAVLKLMEELGELARELLRGLDTPMPSDAARKEYADVGLTLYALGNLLGLDLAAEMRAVVDGETRRFR